MKCLVTGGAGFIGTNLIKRLLKDGHEVVSVDNYSTGKKENEQKGCRYYDYDLSSRHTLGIYVDHQSYPVWRELEYDVIFHIAALARIQPSLINPMENIKNNVLSTLHMLEWARNNNTPVVYAGSSSKHHAPYGSAYAWSKWSGEQLCQLYNECYDLPTVICRFYNVYGPHQLTEGEYCTLIGIFETLYKEGKPLTITWDGEQRRDFTHVDDIVDGLILAAEDNSGETYELGSGKNYSVNEIAVAFDALWTAKYIDRRPGEMRETLCTDMKARDMLGWNPKRDVIDFIKENYILDK